MEGNSTSMIKLVALHTSALSVTIYTTFEWPTSIITSLIYSAMKPLSFTSPEQSKAFKNIGPLSVTPSITYNPYTFFFPWIFLLVVIGSGSTSIENIDDIVYNDRKK